MSISDIPLFYTKVMKRILNLKNLLIVLCLLILSTNIVFAKTKPEVRVILPSNMPKEITVQSIQTTKGSIIFNLKNTSKTMFSFILDEAVFVDSNGNSHKLMSTMGLVNYIENEPIADAPIYTGNLRSTFEVFPLENNRVKKAFKDYEEKNNLSIYPYFTYRTALFGKDSPIQNKDFVLIIPCKNNKDFTTQNLVFKFQPYD